MRFLYAGDIVGRPGREAVLALVPQLRQSEGLDAVVINCENAADDGRGIRPDQADRLLGAGQVDVLTGGNHLLANKSILPYLSRQPRLVRSANDPRAPGQGSYALQLGSRRLGVIQVEGLVFLRKLSCPFAAVAQELDRLGPCTAIFLDVHAEASSEKQALAQHFTGRVSAVVGSHTHVQTADERILRGHTAYLTDAGMTGPYDSIIGMDVDTALQRFLEPERKAPERQLASGDVRLCGAIIEVDDASGRATSIRRIQVPFVSRPAYLMRR
jgi:metallophosphoesterase (TIGR00282 family)